MGLHPSFKFLVASPLFQGPSRRSYGHKRGLVLVPRPIDAPRMAWTNYRGVSDKRRWSGERAMG